MPKPQRLSQINVSSFIHLIRALIITLARLLGYSIITKLWSRLSYTSTAVMAYEALTPTKRLKTSSGQPDDSGWAIVRCSAVHSLRSHGPPVPFVSDAPCIEDRGTAEPKIGSGTPLLETRLELQLSDSSSDSWYYGTNLAFYSMVSFLKVWTFFCHRDDGS